MVTGFPVQRFYPSAYLVFNLNKQPDTVRQKTPGEIFALQKPAANEIAAKKEAAMLFLAA
jgi:hypothetical protein